MGDGGAPLWSGLPATLAWRPKQQLLTAVLVASIAVGCGEHVSITHTSATATTSQSLTTTDVVSTQISQSTEVNMTSEIEIRRVAAERLGTDPDELRVTGPDDWTPRCKLWSVLDPRTPHGGWVAVAEIADGTLVAGRGEQQLVELRSTCLTPGELPSSAVAKSLVSGFAPNLPWGFSFDSTDVQVSASGDRGTNDSGIQIVGLGRDEAGQEQQVEVKITDQTATVTSTNVSRQRTSPTTSRTIVGEVGSEKFGVPAAKLVIDGPRQLSEACELWTATNPADEAMVTVALLPDGSFVFDPGQEQLMSVATQCFLDRGETPTDDAAVAWIETFAPGLPDGFTVLSSPDAVVVESHDDGFSVKLQGIDPDGQRYIVVGDASSNDVSVAVSPKD